MTQQPPEAPASPETLEQAGLAALNDQQPVLTSKGSPSSGTSTGPDSVDPADVLEAGADTDPLEAELQKTLEAQDRKADNAAAAAFYKQAREGRAEVIKELLDVDEVIEGFAEIAGMFAPDGKEEKAAALIRNKKTRSLLMLIGFDRACEYYAEALGGLGNLSPAAAGVAGLVVLGGATAIGVRMAHVEAAEGPAPKGITVPGYSDVRETSAGMVDLNAITQDQWFALSDEERTFLQGQGIAPVGGV